jgi:hypothetical protein
MEKSGGAFDLVVWNEPDLISETWTSTTGTLLNVSPTTVTITFAYSYPTIRIYDPISTNASASTTAIATLHNVSSVTLSLGADPLIVEIEPNSSSQPVIGNANATLVAGVGRKTLVSGVSLTENGATARETFTLAVSDSNGLLSASASGGGSLTGAGTTTLAVSGSLTQVNAALTTLSDTDSVIGGDAITITATDSNGASAWSDSIAVTVNPAPVLTGSAALLTGAGITTSVAGARLSESGSTDSETFTMTLSDSAGTLSATGTGVSGAGTKTLTVTGSLAVVNAALATLTFTDGTAGTDTITLSAVDSLGNAANSTSFAATVLAARSVHMLTASTTSATGGSGADLFVATNGALHTGETIDGRGGTNTLVFSGGGIFDLRAPATLANIQLIAATEGQPAYVTGTGATIAGTAQTVYLRAGTAFTVAVSGAATLNAANPQVAGIAIYGADNRDVINLGPGSDTVYLGGTAETVVGGTGPATIYATAATIGATIAGGSGITQLVVQGGGTVTMGANITNVDAVTLAAATSGTTLAPYLFTANATKGLDIVASSGGDTIAVGDASQTVVASTATGHGDTHVVASAADAGVNLTAAGGNILEITGGGTASLNAGLNSAIVLLDAPTVLYTSKMSFLTINAIDGNSTIHAEAGGQTIIAGADDVFDDATGSGMTVKGLAALFQGTTITNFNSHDFIDITNLTAASATDSYSRGVLSLTDGTHSTAITLGGIVSGGSFHISSDGQGGTSITYS